MRFCFHSHLSPNLMSLESKNLAKLISLILREQPPNQHPSFITGLLRNTSMNPKTSPDPWTLQPPKTTEGIVHVHVSDLARMIAHYRKILAGPKYVQTILNKIQSLSTWTISGRISLVQSESNTVTYFELSDPPNSLNVGCFLTRKENENVENVGVGMFVRIQGPTILEQIWCRITDDFPLAFHVADQTSIEVVEKSISFGPCQQEKCPRMVDKTRGERLCEYHLETQLRQSKYKRSDIQTSIVQGAFGDPSGCGHRYYRHGKWILSTSGKIHTKGMGTQTKRRGVHSKDDPKPDVKKLAETYPLPVLGRKDPDNDEHDSDILIL